MENLTLTHPLRRKRLKNYLKSLSGLIAYYPMWEKEGTLCRNYAPSTLNSNNGTITGVDFVAGKISGAYSLDSTDKVAVGNVLTLGETTFCFMFKSAHSSGNKGIIAVKGTGASKGLAMIGTTPLLILGEQNYQYFADVSSYLDGNWHMVVVYIAGAVLASIDNCSLKIDGNTISKGSKNKDGDPETWTDFTIGSSSYGTLVASYSHFSVFNRALTSTELTKIKNLMGI